MHGKEPVHLRASCEAGECRKDPRSAAGFYRAVDGRALLYCPTARRRSDGLALHRAGRKASTLLHSCDTARVPILDSVPCSHKGVLRALRIFLSPRERNIEAKCAEDLASHISDAVGEVNTWKLDRRRTK